MRPFLESDPIENAFAWHWAFQQKGRDLYVDRIPPTAILTESHANPPITFRFSVLAGADRESARIVLQAARPGEAFRSVRVQVAKPGLEARTISGYYP